MGVCRLPRQMIRMYFGINLRVESHLVISEGHFREDFRVKTLIERGSEGRFIPPATSAYSAIPLDPCEELFSDILSGG